MLQLAIASVLPTRSGEARLGNVIVRHEHRGNGLGSIIVGNILETYDDVILNWSSAADPFYLKLGCKLLRESVFCSMVIDIDEAKVNDYIQSSCAGNGNHDPLQITPLTTGKMDSLIEYDAGVRGYEFKQLMFLLPNISDLVLLALGENEKRIVGYVALEKEYTNRLLVNGFYADSDIIAVSLLKSALDYFLERMRLNYSGLISRPFLQSMATVVTNQSESQFSNNGAIPVMPCINKVYCLDSM